MMNNKNAIFTLIMKSRFALASIVAAACWFSSCDEGDIHPAEVGSDLSGSRIVHLTATITGADALPQGYSLVLAGFEDGADYTALQKAVTVSDDGRIDLTLTAPSELLNFELCVTNSVRKRIVTLASVTADGAGEVEFPVGTTDVSGLALVQRAVFTPSCASCHGVASARNANLCLAEGQSAANLVGVASQRVLGAQRVQPGQPSASVLHQVIDSNIPEVAMPHADILDAKKKGDLLDLIDAWILIINY